MFPAVVLAFVLGLAFAGVGIFLLTSGGRRTRSWRTFTRTAVITKGEVLDLRYRHSSGRLDTDDHGYYVPLVRFSLPDGRVVEAETMLGSQPAPAHHGEVVDVRYDPKEPTRVNLVQGRLAQGSTMGCLQIGIGVVFTLVGLLAVAIAVLVVVLTR